MLKPLAAVGALLCLFAVALGAYSSHGGGISEAERRSLEVAVRYQMWHGLAIILLSTLPLSRRWLTGIGSSFVLAIVLFSGSIYGLIFGQWHALWWMTPVGGSLLIGCWAALILGCYIGQRK
ncbi:DUF423 domain-containing protein [Neiella marina]|uniref:DUF423 domain-containing protein n=1 Tax=Neiella holothuriorum TaxID=2870530 RepID=A0ABS7EHL4_9GAMM|nr:DUF423 domain-containing protein [Neiella holothuriorum]MBW8191844.1 DUF423 domain-containing protein [Neiella holothuriorum]